MACAMSPIWMAPYARQEPLHAGAVLVGLGQQLDAVALERGNDPIRCPRSIGPTR
jgi:hypothetical protein